MRENCGRAAPLAHVKLPFAVRGGTVQKVSNSRRFSHMICPYKFSYILLVNCMAFCWKTSEFTAFKSWLYFYFIVHCSDPFFTPQTATLPPAAQASLVFRSSSSVISSCFSFFRVSSSNWRTFSVKLVWEVAISCSFAIPVSSARK